MGWFNHQLVSGRVSTGDKLPYQLVQEFIHQQYVSFREGIWWYGDKWWFPGKKHRDLITNLINGESGRVNIWMFPKNSGTPNSHPKMIIFSRKTYGCWMLLGTTILGNTHINPLIPWDLSGGFHPLWGWTSLRQAVEVGRAMLSLGADWFGCFFFENPTWMSMEVSN